MNPTEYFKKIKHVKEFLKFIDSKLADILVDDTIKEELHHLKQAIIRNNKTALKMYN